MALSPEEKRERQLEAKRRYNARNKEKRAEYRKKWKAENPDKVAEYQRRHRKKHPEKWKEWDKNYKEKNRELLSEKQKRYANENPIIYGTERYKEMHRKASREYMRKPYVRAREKLRSKFGVMPPQELIELQMQVTKLKRELRNEEC